MNIQEVMDILPHRYPFLMIDRVTQIEPGTSANGYKLISHNEWFMSGASTFMPDSLIIEALAQLGAFTAVQSQQGSLGFLSSLKGVESMGSAYAGDKLELSYEVLRSKKGFTIGKGEASVDGRVILRADEIMIYTA
ncbi:3-hydroxyacyl-ACP dehydratase FabZ family protein [Paenibacillus sp. NAIST15-1]|uniref:3-hydroxyacyl-ACP dehydratase FabZ family protein n=1 Tax=Paenibacillus sp. NAIST15-1 TaxID=1605994 RepID=UPI00086E5B12|nr:3-hydroxyacyl-ACP dehydratase FabZ family protein [Paenibacillus sp. NAIST15-1]GAV13472.1 (3R)-hydroxymyristoyl-ACP dehydratase [Paenibacillus sp. NAIST15-1]